MKSKFIYTLIIINFYTVNTQDVKSSFGRIVMILTGESSIRDTKAFIDVSWWSSTNG
jgi:hypothetical protein